MSAARRRRLRRIAITFRAGDAEPQWIPALGRLADDGRVELAGVFIEDTDLLRAAALPFTRELCRSTNEVRPVETDTLVRQMRQRAAAAQRVLAEFASRTGMRFSFRTVRHREVVAVLETARSVDLTVTGMPAGSAPSARGRHVVVIVDRSPAAARALDVAGTLGGKTSLRVVAVGRTEPGLARLVERIRAQAPPDAEVQALYRPDFQRILTVVRAEGPAAVVLPIGLLDPAPERLEALGETLRCPVLIVS